MEIVTGFLNLFSPAVFLSMSAGVAWGIICGALPGLGATIGIALLIPFTFTMSPVVALPMLAGVYAGAIYGGGITAILLGVPGTSADAATVFDGHPMAQKGMARKALRTSVTSSAIGGMFAAIVLLLLAPPLARLSLAFGPHEYFLIAIFGLTVIAAVSPGSILKGLIAGALGLMLGTVGLDPIMGEMRFGFGYVELFDGLPLIPLLLGLFAFPQCLKFTEDLVTKGLSQININTDSIDTSTLTLSEVWGMKRTLTRSALLGTIIGIIPGAGAAIAGFVSYAAEKRAAKDPTKMGTGIPEGVAASEAANNGVCSGSLVPLLTLSIPGSPTAAVILGALMIHGMVPGPELFTKYAEPTYTFLAAGFVCNIVMLLMGWYGSNIFGKIANIPTVILAPSMLVICFTGAYAVRQQFFDLGLMILIGVVAWFLTRYGYPMASVLLGVILGPISESGFRRAMLISDGDYMTFFHRPLSIVLIILTFFSLYAGWKLTQRMESFAAEAIDHADELVKKGQQKTA